MIQARGRASSLAVGHHRRGLGPNCGASPAQRQQPISGIAFATGATANLVSNKVKVNKIKSAKD